MVMCYRDHALPHFHAQYGDDEVVVQIQSGVVDGRFPKRALGHVLEWLDLHRGELLANWERAGLAGDCPIKATRGRDDTRAAQSPPGRPLT